MNVYFDYAATAPVCAAAVSAFNEALSHIGNPSSLHSLGFDSEKLMTSSRQVILDTVCRPQSKATLIFTGSGSESNNLAVFGTAYSKPAFSGGHIIISDSEHPSVTNAVRELERRGYRVSTVATRGGVIDPDELVSKIEDNTFLISVMTANNESGALYDIPSLVKAAKNKKPDVVFHTDATQAYMKCFIEKETAGADMITVSAHKIGGVRGVGALLVSDCIIRKKLLLPLIFGGGQEGNLRSGTENVAGIAAFAAAASFNRQGLAENIEKMRSLGAFISKKAEELGITVNKPPVSVPSVVSLTLPGIKSEVMLHYLSGNGIFVSSGSACSSHHPGVSAAMTAFGLTSRQADCTVRVSLSPQSTQDEAVLLISAMENGLGKLVRVR